MIIEGLPRVLMWKATVIDYDGRLGCLFFLWADPCSINAEEFRAYIKKRKRGENHG